MIFQAYREAGRQFFLQPCAAITAELDAINLYEQTAAMATDENIRTVLLDVAREEKTRVGEFQALLLSSTRNRPRSWHAEKKWKKL